MAKTDTIVFDIGNVLVDFCWKDHIESFGYNRETNERVAKASVLSPAWKEYDRGLLGDEEILDGFVANDPSVEEPIRRIFASLTGLLKQYDYTKPWIKDLKKRGYRVLYLSNFSEKADRDCAEELDFIPLTDGGILSYKVRIIKPDPAIYKLLTGTYGLVPKRCIFFDDTPENVEAARALGFNAEVFESYERAEYIIKRLS